MFELAMQLKKKQQNWKESKERSKAANASGAGEGGGAAASGGGGSGRDREQRRALKDRDWVVNNVLKYLQTTPASEQTAKDAHQLLAKLTEMEVRRGLFPTPTVPLYATAAATTNRRRTRQWS